MTSRTLIFLLLQCSTSCLAQVHLGPGQTYPNIQAAVGANAIQPGDTVFLHAGSYSGYQLVSDLKGANNAWIVIKRYQNDPVAISGGWQLVRCAYLKFQHLNFEGSTTHPGRLLSIDNGGSCTTQSQFIMVDSCSFSKTTDPAASVAFKFAGVDHFEVTHCLFRDIPACEAMSFNTCHDGVIRGNRFENCLSGGHIKGGSSDITMERNLFIHASQAPWVAYELGGDTGAQFYCPEDHFEVKNLHFFSNIIIGGYRGLALSSARDCKIINNTFYNCGQATMRFLTTSTLYPALFGNQVENNLFAFGASAYFNGGTQPANSVTFSNNLYYSILNPTFNGPYWDSPALDAIKDPNPLNDGSNKPMFVNGPANDFHLSAGSPAIGSGKAQTEPETDFFGLPFSVTTRAIGAIEVKNSTNIHQAIENGAPDPIVIFPNPATDYVEVHTSGGRRLIEIWNLLGLKVLESQSDQRIPIGHLPSGVYFLKVGAAVYPLVKQ